MPGDTTTMQIREVVLAIVLAQATLLCQTARTQLSDNEKAIATELKGLRAVPDNDRAAVTTRIALEICKLSPNPSKVDLANELANLSTEGDFGHGTLQEVGVTLAEALREQPPQAEDTFMELALLIRYEHVQVVFDNPQLNAVLLRLRDMDRDREHANFTLKDLAGKPWTLGDLQGHVVVVNFWATWCPPCRKEMPDLDALYQRFQSQGLIVLAISDEDLSKVTPFLAQHGVKYPILLDPGRKVNDLFHVDSIPRTFIYDKQGKLAAQAIDMRTRDQFLELIRKAGLE